jgi:hypothetical protein
VLIPDKATVDVALGPVKENTRFAVFPPGDVGANAICRVQLALAARVAPQLFVRVNSFASDPVRLTLATVSGAAPVFVSVRIWAADVAPGATLAKVRLALLSEGDPARAAPVPLSVTVSITGIKVVASATVIVNAAVSDAVEDG